MSNARKRARSRPYGPWSPTKATEELRKIARQDFDFCWTAHVIERMEDRDLIVGDVVHVLKHGFVYDEAEKSTREGYFKYKIECTSPNSGARTVRVVVIPEQKPLTLKIVTVMWVDETRRT